jgi:hypothetical protein
MGSVNDGWTEWEEQQSLRGPHTVNGLEVPVNGQDKSSSTLSPVRAHAPNQARTGTGAHTLEWQSVRHWAKEQDDRVVGRAGSLV